MLLFDSGLARRHSILFLQRLKAGRNKHGAAEGQVHGARADHEPEQQHSERDDHGGNLEKMAVEIGGEKRGTGAPNAEREGETPPAHVERKAGGGSEADKGKADPEQGEPPHDEGEEDAEDVEDLGGAGRVETGGDGGGKGGGLGQAPQGDLAELLDAEAALAERANGQEDGYDNVAWGQVVDGETVKVEGKDAGGEGLANAPEDVGDDEGHVGAARVRKHLGDDAAGGGGDDGGHDGKKQRGRSVFETGPVPVHDDEGHGDAGGYGEERVDPPKRPGEVDEPATPMAAGKDHHVDDGCRVVGLVKGAFLSRGGGVGCGLLAKPMGKQPRKRDCPGCASMALQIFG